MRILLVSLVTIVMCSGSYAADLRELEEKIEALTNEIANMKEKMALPAAAEKSFGGMGLGASKVYFSQSPLSIGGYGELIVQNTQGEGVDKTDALRLIPYIGYRFNDWIIFNSEIEFEHSGIFGKSRTATDSGGDTVKVTEPAGEVVVEFAYLDFLVAKNLNVRVGHVLLPFGITNLQHEPTLIPSVNRSEVEKNIIPTTWHENGVLVHGEWNDFSYSIGLVNSMDAANFSDSSWIRSGRQKGAEAKAEDWATVARLDWLAVHDLTLGMSFYNGDSGQGSAAIGDATVTLWEAHMLYSLRGLKLKGLFVQGELTDSAAVSTAAGKVVGKKAYGYYLEGQYNLWSHIAPESEKAVNVFARFEEYNPHDEVLGTENRTLHKRRTVLGVTYLPIANVILKADYQMRENKTVDEADFVELGMGYVF